MDEDTGSNAMASCTKSRDSRYLRAAQHLEKPEDLTSLKDRSEDHVPVFIRLFDGSV
jgi:hypothetical protein